jgi:hypothetical protein
MRRYVDERRRVERGCAGAGGRPSNGDGGSGGDSAGGTSNAGSAGSGGAIGGVDAGGIRGATDAGNDSGAGGAAKVPLPFCDGQCADLTTDSYNCGMCGKVCQPSGMAYNLDAPGSLAADSGFIYWGEHIANGRIFQLPLGSANTANPPAIAAGQRTRTPSSSTRPMFTGSPTTA